MTSSIPQLIESCGFCRADEVEGLQKMKTGMTNRSYSFFARGGQYIIRVPGEGTEQMINRAQEHAVYSVIAPLGISEEVHYFDPVSGIKISSFLKGMHTCRPDDWEEVALCMRALRSFHGRKLHVEHSFDLWERIDFYESLWNGEKSLYADYRQTKETVLSLRRFIDAQPKTLQLCHIDSIPDNFLFSESAYNEKTIKLIDWEYSGTQDPHLDIAMFIVYAMYDRAWADRLIDMYFTEGCDEAVRLKIYCYIAISGLLWSNWCEFKHHCGIDFGEYALRQYEYAKEYSSIFIDEYRKRFGEAYV